MCKSRKGWRNKNSRFERLKCGYEGYLPNIIKHVDQGFLPPIQDSLSLPQSVVSQGWEWYPSEVWCYTTVYSKHRVYRHFPQCICH